MKKLLTILMLVAAVLVGGMTVEAKPTKKKSRSKTASYSERRSGGRSSQPMVGMFDMPLDDSELTLEHYGLLKDSKVKSVVRAYECGGDSLVFNENGKIILRESWSECTTLYPNLRNYEYNTEGRLIKYTHSWTDDFFDPEEGVFWDFGPYFSTIYKYDWENGKITSITETIQVDGGLNYSGTTHLDLIYDSTGNLKEAVCRENPKIKMRFKDNNTKTYEASYWGNYEPRSYKRLLQKSRNNPKLRDVKIGQFNCMVNLDNKLPIKWGLFTNENFYYNDGEEKPTIINKDSKGNWTLNDSGEKRTIYYF